jgi:hypothetical protein
MNVFEAAEAIILPVVPDVGLCLLVLAAPRRAAQQLLAIVAGALVGTLLLAVLSTAAPNDVRSMLLSLPGIDATMLAEADMTLADRGSPVCQFGPGAPLKVCTRRVGGRRRDVPGLLAGPCSIG